MKLGQAWILGTLILFAGAVDAARSQDRVGLWGSRPATPVTLRDGGVLSATRLVLLPTVGDLPGAMAEGGLLRQKLPPLPTKEYRLPGEFERQAALLLGCCELVREMPDVFADLIEATRGSVEIIALVNGQHEFETATQTLNARMIPVGKIRYVEVSHNTMWARDYGPTVVEADGKPSLVDTIYGEVVRPEDDQVPRTLAKRLNLPVIQAPFQLEGGNLLSNGRGICITTEMLIHANSARVDEPNLRRWLKHLYGAKQTIFLEPLVGESTAHVDMFATFTSSDTVVVGAYDPAVDPENAEILDRNAERLSEVVVDGRNLQVVRIPMPSHDDGSWRTYTNVVFANGVLLVPIYLGVDEKGRQKALEIYAQLLPGWRIVGIDAGKLIECAGALHCITMNLGPLGRIPDFPRPTRKDQPESALQRIADPGPANDATRFRVSSFGD